MGVACNGCWELNLQVEGEQTCKIREPSFQPSTLVFGKGLSMNSELSNLARLAGQQSSETHMSLSPQGWDYRSVGAVCGSLCGAGEPKAVPQALD